MIEDQSIGFISPPGDTIADMIEERGWTRAELAKRLDVTPKHVNELLHGRASISPGTASALASVLGSSAEFWLNREAQYRARVEERSRYESLAAETEWLQSVPYGWMAKHGWVPDFAHSGQRIDAVLRYFGVATLNAYKKTYGEMRLAFRASATYTAADGAVSVWLRRAELEATQAETAEWSPARLRAELPAFRALTMQTDVTTLRLELAGRAARCGVAVVFVPPPPECPVSGATFFLSPARAVIALTLRHKSNDHLWFTFFHEVGHLLLHGKKERFLEGIGMVDPALELEADHFARDTLIPPAWAASLGSLRRAADVKRFASEVGVHPAIVVGRLQREGVVSWSALNGLKQRVSW
jgi:HTH-type transcriptional regulator/antitoxin HigA